ncbi:hypothetical protein [Streptomyces sp. CA-179760]|uniref:hypothetical protein n=1 Tax=Streptomyces sp. CA-179760 TaxID=3240054 RepID=UPI003D92F0E8
MSWLNVKHAMELSPWIRIPLMWPEPGLEDVEEAQTPEAWARYFAEGLWEDFAPEKPKPGEVDLLTNILLMYAIRAPAAFPDFEVFLHLPHPGRFRFLYMSTWWRSRRVKTGKRHCVN